MLLYYIVIVASVVVYGLQMGIYRASMRLRAFVNYPRSMSSNPVNEPPVDPTNAGPVRNFGDRHGCDITRSKLFSAQFDPLTPLVQFGFADFDPERA